MKNKLINFMVALGIPLGAIGVGSGCTGVCGSCKMSCAPGIFVALVLGCNVLYKKFKARTEHGHV